MLLKVNCLGQFRSKMAVLAQKLHRFGSARATKFWLYLWILDGNMSMLAMWLPTPWCGSQHHGVAANTMEEMVMDPLNRGTPRVTEV